MLGHDTAPEYLAAFTIDAQWREDPLRLVVARSVDRAIARRTEGPLLLDTMGRRLDRHSATRRVRHLADEAGVRLPRMHPHMLRHHHARRRRRPRDVQTAARHADPRTTMRYDRARTTPDRHPNDILAASVAPGT